MMGSRSKGIRLLLIPLLVYCAWVLELFLLEGEPRLFVEYPDPSGIFLYTLIGCVLTGIVIPVICIRKAFVSGAVNMFQLGFRSIRRTVITCSGTAAFVYAVIVLMQPFGGNKWAFLTAFLLFLPTAIASVMICWVLIGTHLQAFVRGGGALISISVGVVITSLLFAISTLALSPATGNRDPLFWPVCAGIAIALFFFAVRDMYATVLLAAVSNILSTGSSINPSYLQTITPVFFVSPVVAAAILVCLHWYLTRNYATIILPAGT